MNATPLDIKTQDGVVDGFFFQPEDGGKHPAVIFYMDGIGLRQGLYDMAKQLTENGYAVLMPNMFYRYGPAQPLDFATDRDKIMEMIFSLNEKGMMQDTEHFLAYLDAQPGVLGPKVGCTGYCMGGAPSLTSSATFPDRVVAAASFHGGRLATDAPDSPHLLAPEMRGELYIGVAGEDHYLGPGETERLDNALKEANDNYKLEIYEGAQHGFAVPDIPAYNPEAAERHWQNLLALFARNLPQD